MGDMQMMPSKLALVAVFTAGGLTAASQLAKGETPGARILIGSTIAAVMLSAAAGPAPGIVRALSVVIILGALLGPGYALVKPLAKLAS